MLVVLRDTSGIIIMCVSMYSKFRHPCNSQTTLKTTLVLLYKLLLYSYLWAYQINYTCGFSPSCFSIAKVLESTVSTCILNSLCVQAETVYAGFDSSDQVTTGTL